MKGAQTTTKPGKVYVVTKKTSAGSVGTSGGGKVSRLSVESLFANNYLISNYCL